MRLHETQKRPPRARCRPGLEALETRDLMAIAAPRPASIDPALISNFVSKLYGPVTTTQPIKIGNNVFPPGTYTDVPQPTAAEIQRESFSIEFVGRYVIGPPRFSNRRRPDNPHLQQRHECDVKPVPPRSIPDHPLPAGRSHRQTNDE